MLPIILSVIGSLLPSIVDSLRSGKSPEEAAAIVAPKRKALIDRLVGSGVASSAAEALADEAMQSELEKAQLPEAMNPLVMSALSVAGMFGGMKAGNMIKARGVAKAAATKPASAPSPDEVKAATKPVVSSKTEEVAEGTAHNVIEEATEDVYKPGFRSPAIDKAMTGSMDSVTAGGPFPSGRNIGYSDPSPATLARLSPPSSRVGYTPQLGTPFQRDTVIPAGFDPRKAVDAEFRVTSGSVPSRLKPGITDRDMEIEQIMKEMQMAEMRAARAASTPQPDRLMRTPGTSLVAPWE